MKGEKDKAGNPSPVASTEKKSGLSPDETRAKIEVHTRLSESVVASRPVHDIKARYQDIEHKTKDIEAKTASHYAMGKQAGLPQAPFEQLKASADHYAQKDRDQIVADLKQRYQSGPTLSKEFKQAKTPGEMTQDFKAIHDKSQEKGKTGRKK